MTHEKTVERRKEVYRRYCEGEGVGALAYEYGVKPGTIKDYIRFFQREEKRERFRAEQEERERKERNSQLIQEPLINTAEYLYSIVDRLPQNITVEVLRADGMISVTLCGDGQNVNINSEMR